MNHCFPLADDKHELGVRFNAVPPRGLTTWIQLVGQPDMVGGGSHRTIHFDFTPPDDDALRAIEAALLVWLQDPTHRPLIEGRGFSMMSEFAYVLRWVAEATHANYIAHHYELRKMAGDEPEEDWALISGYGIHGVEPAKLYLQSDTEQLGGVCLICWGRFRATRSTAEAVCSWFNSGYLEHGLQFVAQKRIDDFLAGRRSLTVPVTVPIE